jgi:hypothetical protein
VHVHVQSSRNITANLAYVQRHCTLRANGAFSR